MKTATSSTDYKAIRAWGISLGSFDYYIDRVQHEALRDGAPIDALYKPDGGKWICMSDLKPDHSFRAEFKRMFPDA